MRSRLTLIFLGVVVVVGVFAVAFGRPMVSHAVRAREQDALADDARAAAAVLDRQYAVGGEDAAATAGAIAADLAGDHARITVQHPGEPTFTTSATGFPADEGADTLRATERVGDTTVTLLHDQEHVASITDDAVSALMVTIAATLGVALLLCVFLARQISQPIVALAEGASALGRGRFDVQVPHSSVPEIAELGEALRSSAQSLEQFFLRGRETLQLTSHTLRTPLTGMRLELEGALLDDLEDETRQSVERCLRDVTRLEHTVTQLLQVEQSRRPGSGLVSLAELRPSVKSRWRNCLPTRRVTVEIDRGHDLEVTPGPIEQVLDQVMADVAVHGAGPVEMCLSAEESHVRITVRCSAGPEPVPDVRPAVIAAESVTTEVLGGRWSGDPVGEGLEILLPRR